MKIFHNISVLFSMMRLSIKSALTYRVSFIVDIVTSIMMFTSEFFVVYLMVDEMNEINGWTKEQIAVMYVITILAGAIEVFFTDQMRNFSNKILWGNLDLDLVRPFHPLLRTMGDVSFSALLNVVIFSAVIITYITIIVPGLWTLRNIVVFVISVIGGALIFSSITIFSCAISFWTFDSQFFYRLVKQGTRQLLWYPMDIYNKIIRIVLTFVYPLAFVSYYPSLVIFDKDTQGVPAAFCCRSILIGLVLCSLAVGLWHIGVKKYEGSGC